MATSAAPCLFHQSDQDMIDEFVAQSDAATSTRYKYRVQLVEFARWLAITREDHKHGHLLDSTPREVGRFMAYLDSADRFAARTPQQRTNALSASSRKNYLASIHSLYRYLVSMNVIAVDPSRSIRAPQVRIKRGLHLTADELRILLDAHGSARERIVTYLLAFTAARSGELRDLRWQDVDLEHRVITLRGKRGKVRHVDIHPRLMVELRRWLIHQGSEAERYPAVYAAKLDVDTDLVLLTRNGTAVPPASIAKQIKARAARAGLHVRDPASSPYNASDVSPHALRRTFATILLNQGHPIDAVADVLGHASIDTTRSHYAFSNDARRRATIHAFNP